MAGIKLINLMSHTVKLLGADGRETEIPPSGTVARCEEIEVGEVTVDGMKVSV